MTGDPRRARPVVLLYGGSGACAAALRAAGYDPIVAGDREAALACADARRPHAIVIDLAGAPWLDGVGLARSLRARSRRTAIIARGAADLVGWRHEARQAGCDALVRTTEPERIASVVAREIRRREAERKEPERDRRRNR